jgi:hypothetical protein
VDHRVGECEAVALERRAEQGIVEEAERAERIRWPQVGVETPVGELLRVAAGLAEVEVPFVGYPSDNGEPPGVRFQRIPEGGRQDEN